MFKNILIKLRPYYFVILILILCTILSSDFLLQINPNLTCLNKDSISRIPNLNYFSYTITSINSDGNIKFNYDNVVDIYKTSTSTYILSLDEKSSNWLINIE